MQLVWDPGQRLLIAPLGQRRNVVFIALVVTIGYGLLLRAGIGERVALPSGAHAVVTVRLSARDGESHPVTVRLIRSGEIIGMTKAETPVQYQLADAQPVPDGGAYYRLEVVGQSGELLTNPIYAAAQAGERG